MSTRSPNEQHAREREAAAPELFRLIAEYTYDWETWVDAEGVPRWINAAVERVTGFSVEECLHLPSYPLPLVHEADRAMLASVLADAARGGSGNDLEFRVVDKQGQERWVAISWQTVFGADGISKGYRTSVRDIDERKRMERELRLMRQRAEAAVIARSELLANVSHELRSPAHCIAGFAELLLLTSLDAKQKRYVEVVGEQCTAMLRQVEDLLQFAALEAGGVRLEREPLELGELVRGLMDAAGPTAQARGLTLESELRGAPAWVEGDATRLIQVFRNLLDNALKFTDQGAVRVRLTVQPVEPKRDLCRIQFEVEDTGGGMRPEDTRRLLAPFQQGDGASTRRHGGVGLGLAIAQRLVRHMGGQLELESALGQGTRVSVHVQLPVAAPRSKPLTPTPQVPSAGRALIVDDSAPARELLRAMLELAGWHVREADSGDQARALTAEETPD